MWQNPHAGQNMQMQQTQQNPVQMLQQLQAQITQLRFQLNQNPNNYILAQQLQQLEAQYNQLYIQVMQMQQRQTGMQPNMMQSGMNQSGWMQQPQSPSAQTNRFDSPGVQTQQFTTPAQATLQQTPVEGNRFGEPAQTQPTAPQSQMPTLPDFETTDAVATVTDFQISENLKLGEKIMVEDKLIIVDCVTEGLESIREAYYSKQLKRTGLLRPVTIVKPFYRVHKTRSAGRYKEDNLIKYIHDLPVDDPQLNIHDKYFISYFDEFITQRINTFLNIHMGDEVYIDSAINDIQDLGDFLKQPENKVFLSYWREFLKQEYARLRSINELMETMDEEERKEVFSARDTGTHVNFFATPVNMLYAEVLLDEVMEETYLAGKYYTVNEATLSDSIIELALEHLNALKTSENELREFVMITVDDHAFHFIENYQSVLYVSYRGNIC